MAKISLTLNHDEEIALIVEGIDGTLLSLSLTQDELAQIQNMMFECLEKIQEDDELDDEEWYCELETA